MAENDSPVAADTAPPPSAVQASIGSEAFSKLTIAELLRRLTVGAWLSVGGALASAYSAGVASSNWSVIQTLFAQQSSFTIQDFRSKAITEKSTYVIDAGSDRVVLFVKDVSIARRVLEVEAGIDGGTREFFQVHPNAIKTLPIGAKVYEIVVHDLARASFGQDIAVVSLKERLRSKP